MSDPMDDFSEEEFLATEKLIKDWDYKDFLGLMNYVKNLWWMPDWGWDETTTEEGVEYSISTGGWSGNEFLINALENNYMFWLCCWESSRRGGHFTFTVKDYGRSAAPAASTLVTVSSEATKP